jgi:hypothetical protein
MAIKWQNLIVSNIVIINLIVVNIGSDVLDKTNENSFLLDSGRFIPQLIYLPEIWLSFK